MVQGFRPTPQFSLDAVRDRGLLRAGLQKSVFVGYEAAVAADANPTPLIEIANVRRSCIQFMLDGSFSAGEGTVALPTRVEWQVYRGAGCTPDADPVARGVTILKELRRSGLMFQIDCAAAGTWWLCGRIMDPVGDRVSLRASVRVMLQQTSGLPQVVSGSAIG